MRLRSENWEINVFVGTKLGNNLLLLRGRIWKEDSGKNVALPELGRLPVRFWLEHLLQLKLLHFIIKKTRIRNS